MQAENRRFEAIHSTIMHSGNKSESYLQTKMRLYQQQKEKSSVSLPPDSDSLLQALKRVQIENVL